MSFFYSCMSSGSVEELTVSGKIIKKEDEKMQLMQRLGAVPTNESYYDDYIAAIRKRPGSCDNVWLATHYGFPPLEKHKQLAEEYVKIAGKFRANGISVSLQLSNSLGHGQYMAAKDNTGLVYEGSPVEKMIGHDGTVADYGFCWRGKHVRKYLVEELSYYAQIKPECIWVDDDFRANNHKPVDWGCYCDNCIRAFNDRYGSSFTREALVEEITHGDLIWRERFIEFIRQGMYELMYEMSKAVHKVSPETAMGYQYCANGGYTGYGYGFIFDAMKNATGIIPKSRPGGGTYTDHNPNDIIGKALYLNWANSMLPSYVECRCPEIENTPFAAFGKSPAGMAFESTYYFANGNTDMSYSMLMRLTEPMEWHDREFALLADYRPYWERLANYNKDSYQAGIRFFMSKYIWRKQLGEKEGLAEMNAEPFDGARLLLRDGIPVALGEEEDSLYMLHPEVARVLSEEEIAYLLDRNVVTDAESLAILMERGVDLGVKAVKIGEQAVYLYEKMSAHKVIPDGFVRWSNSAFTEGRNNIYYLEKEQDSVEVISRYDANAVIDPFLEDKTCPYGIASAIVTTPKGKKWSVMSLAPWKGIISYNRREQMLNMADYISGNALCARLLSPVQAVLLPRKDKQGKTVCVSVTNCTIGNSGSLELLIRNPAGRDFRFMTQGKEEIRLEYERAGEDYIVKIPDMAAWTVGTVFILNRRS